MRIKNRTKKQPRIEILPLIDIVFLLLIFFVYAMLSMAVHRGLHLELPESGVAEKSKETPHSLFVQKKEGKIKFFLNEEPLASLEELTLSLHHSVNIDENLDDNSILIFADKDVSYQELFTVLDSVKQAGIQAISLQAIKKE